MVGNESLASIGHARRRWLVAISTVAAAMFAGLMALWAGKFDRVEPSPERVGAKIPAEYFGLTINSIGQRPIWPEVDFSGIRLWGAIYWAEINPAPGVFNWARFDAILEIAHRRNIDVVLNLAYTPRWAATEKDARPAFSPGASSPPADIRSWEDFVGAAVRRAAGKIRYWEVWNEPEDPNYYSGDIATMVRLQKRAFETIKGLDPTLMVITPSSNGTAAGYRWQSDFLRAGGGKYADILGFHGYSPNAEEQIAIIGQFKRVFAANGLADKPIWDTEGGWPGNLTDPDAQAAYLARSYLLQWSFGIDRFYWYAYEGGGAAWGKLWDPKEGLLLPGRAYRTVQRWLVGATVLHSVEKHGPVWSMRLRLSDGSEAIVVWTTRNQMTYDLPPGYGRIEDLAGASFPADGAVEIGPKPVLLIAQK